MTSTLATPLKNTFCTCSLPASEKVKIVKITSYSIGVKWQHVAGNDGYEVKIHEVIDNITMSFPVQTIETADSLYIFSNLRSGGEYEISIKAKCPDTQSLSLRTGDDGIATIRGVVHDDVAFSQRPQNPIGDQMAFTYEVAQAENVTIGLFDTQGNEVIRAVNNQAHKVGTYNATVNTADLQRGMYLLSYRSENKVRTIKLIKTQ
jgi:hypothetical protein